MIAIFAVTDAGVTLAQIGAIAAITSIVALMLEIPSGYISDRIGHKNALIIGSVLVMCAPLWFVVLPHFTGVLLESVFFFAGYAFHSGTVQALLHDTLVELKREKEFGAINAHAQKIGLFFFVILVALVPMTYNVHHAAPFVIGFVLQGIVFVASILMTSPRTLSHDKGALQISLFSFLKELARQRQLVFFFFVGLSTGVLHKLPEYREIYLQDIGVSLWIFGAVVAMGNLFGAMLMYGVPRLEKVSHKIFYTTDMLLVICSSLALGFFAQPIVVAGLFIFIVGYARMRQVLMHTHLLAQCTTQNRKATYLSVFEFFSSLHRIWLPLLLGAGIAHFGVAYGYLFFGTVISVLLVALYSISYRRV